MLDTDKARPSNGHRGTIRKLRHRGKSRQPETDIERRGKIPIHSNISDKPREANNRTRIGEWEADTVIGRRGGDHDIFANGHGATISVPRHREIKELTAKTILKMAKRAKALQAEKL